jgi:hypothetical protein
MRIFYKRTQSNMTSAKQLQQHLIQMLHRLSWTPNRPLQYLKQGVSGYLEPEVFREPGWNRGLGVTHKQGFAMPTIFLMFGVLRPPVNVPSSSPSLPACMYMLRNVRPLLNSTRARKEDYPVPCSLTISRRFSVASCTCIA